MRNAQPQRCAARKQRWRKNASRQASKAFLALPASRPFPCLCMPVQPASVSYALSSRDKTSASSLLGAFVHFTEPSLFIAVRALSCTIVISQVGPSIFLPSTPTPLLHLICHLGVEHSNYQTSFSPFLSTHHPPSHPILHRQKPWVKLQDSRVFSRLWY